MLNPNVNLGPVMTKAHSLASALMLREVVYGNPTPTARVPFSFVDVRDVARAHVEALLRPAANRRRFVLVGDASPCDQRELARIANERFPQVGGAASTTAVSRHDPSRRGARRGRKGIMRPVGYSRRIPFCPSRERAREWWNRRRSATHTKKRARPRAARIAQWRFGAPPSVHPLLMDHVLVPLSRLPLGLGDRVMSPFARELASREFRYDNSAARETLGVVFRPLAESIHDGVRSMVDQGFATPKKR